jgi:hypothetical protein
MATRTASARPQGWSVLLAADPEEVGDSCCWRLWPGRDRTPQGKATQASGP